MKIMTVLGTRPEIIRLSLVIRLLDEHAEHLLVHTGQNSHDRLNGIFFRELGVREPDVHLGVQASSFGEQAGQILARIEPVFLDHRPDRVLLLGDTNSSLVAIIARRLGIPVYHMEAGNRCFDDRVPEEVNRRIIDHASSVLLPYTNRSREHLLREGFAPDRVHVIGNPIKQVIDYHAASVAASRALEEHNLIPGKYFLVTAHRAENVDRASSLRDLLDAMVALNRLYGHPVICSLHPRTRARMQEFDFQEQDTGIRFLEPLGFFDFIRLEQNAFCLLSDSGTVQEECCIFGVPAVTLREVTERPETVECGSNFLSGTDPAAVMRGVAFVTANRGRWIPPKEYMEPQVAETVVRILLSFRVADAAELEWRRGERTPVTKAR